MSEPLLVIDDLHLRNRLSGAETVAGVSASLERGKVLGVVGESGSGKTLTCRAVLGILPDVFAISRGRIDLFGQDASALSPRSWQSLRGSRIAAVFQDPGSYLNPSIKVGRQIEEVVRVKGGLRGNAAKARVLELFETVHLREVEYVYQQYTHELSGGMLQRVLIAGAIALEPEILIADEATTALDVTVQAEILDLLVELKERIGLALLVVSHDLAVVAQLCDDVIVLKDGRVVEQGPASQILFAPTHEYTKLLIDEHELYGLDRFLTATGADRG
ncbi:ABC transporter ATP-binding protein [Microbacterium betulae]|uniref:ABC transporter ATP-binding protein n=1 Tax=Microbacterium betulae TaxID=2981139 RepID=A0AA97I7D1_9MICO|nr:ABC transporter ATP-binding protein [Microbacterium sp. AB]WOF23492.1 ABC transporter ATP-binding protein [Microbacterium sp. AB]